VPPGPEVRYGVHFLSSGPGVTPLLSPLAPTLGSTNRQMCAANVRIEISARAGLSERGIHDLSMHEH
jgi:hypothetical protein